MDLASILARMRIEVAVDHERLLSTQTGGDYPRFLMHPVVPLSPILC